MDATHDIGAHLKAVQGTVPVAQTAGAVTGAAIDRTGYQSLKLVLTTGAATGSPSAQTLNCKIRHCDTSGGTYADLSGAATPEADADNEIQSVDVDLAAAKRYLKVVTTAAFTGGTTPGWPNGAAVILGGADVKPAA